MRHRVPDQLLERRAVGLTRRLGGHDGQPVPMAAVNQRATEGGRAIESTIRRPMERSFGESFSHVRIHTDEAIGAHAGLAAVTRGQDITFARGRYEPASLPGRMLLAHELAHVVQQRHARGNGLAPIVDGEREANAVSGRAVMGRSVTISSSPAGGIACNHDDPTTWLERAKRVVRDEIRTRTGEALGAVEGVAMEAAAAVDSVLWPVARGLQMLDRAVERGCDSARLSPSDRATAHQAVNSAVDAVVPGAAQLRQAQGLAAATGSTDPVTKLPSFAAAVGKAGDAADRARIAMVGQGEPEYGIFTAREMGQLEGALAPQIALLLVDVEEVQLVLRAVAGVGALQAIDRARTTHPDTFLHERDFWAAVAQAALFLVGLHASRVGARLREVLVDVGILVLSTSEAAVALQRDYSAYHGADRDRRLAADTQALIRVLAQGIIAAVNHGRQARSRAIEGQAGGRPATESPNSDTGDHPAMPRPVIASGPPPTDGAAAPSAAEARPSKVDVEPRPSAGNPEGAGTANRGHDPSAEPRTDQELGRGAVDVNTLPGVSTFDEAHFEQRGNVGARASGSPGTGPTGKSEARTGMHFNEWNAAEMTLGARWDYDPAGRVLRSVEFDVPEHVGNEGTRPKNFHQDEAMADTGIIHPTDADFTRTGLDRGHAAGQQLSGGDPSVARELMSTMNTWPQEPHVNQRTYKAVESAYVNLKAQNANAPVRVRVEAVIGSPPRTVLSPKTGKRLTVPDAFLVTVSLTPPNGPPVVQSFTVVNR